MKFTFYLDLWPGRLNGAAQFGLEARTQPFDKAAGTRRWAFDVVIPDDVLHEVDAHAPEVSRPRLVE